MINISQPFLVILNKGANNSGGHCECLSLFPKRLVGESLVKLKSKYLPKALEVRSPFPHSGDCSRCDLSLLITLRIHAYLSLFLLLETQKLGVQKLFLNVQMCVVGVHVSHVLMLRSDE